MFFFFLGGRGGGGGASGPLGGFSSRVSICGGGTETVVPDVGLWGYGVERVCCVQRGNSEPHILLNPYFQP